MMREGADAVGQFLGDDQRDREAEGRRTAPAAPSAESSQARAAQSPARRGSRTRRCRRGSVMRSRRNSAASSAVQAGMVNSSANTVANGSSVTAQRPAKLPTKCVVLRARCKPHAARRELAPQLRAQRDQRQQHEQTPTPQRIDRISNMLSCSPSSRIDSAMTENESSAPVIQRTTRPSCGWPRLIALVRGEGPALVAGRRLPSLGVGLVFRPRLVEGRQLQAGRVGRDDLRKLVERHLEPPRVVHLRHQTDVGKRDVARRSSRAPGPIMVSIA